MASGLEPVACSARRPRLCFDQVRHAILPFVDLAGLGLLLTMMISGIASPSSVRGPPDAELGGTAARLWWIMAVLNTVRCAAAFQFNRSA